jgi:platelet-activating factor acetylhydrolase IB subunit alpha
MVLTEKQRADLDAAVLDYLSSRGEEFAEAAAAFAAASQAIATAGSAGMLEKKWTSVVRLQRKVMDLEAALAAAAAETAAGGSRPARDKTSRLLPRAPVAAVLAGHRSPITALAMHPVYALVASASEDATVKVWDLETQQLERTLKGHTNAVQGLAFRYISSQRCLFVAHRPAGAVVRLCAMPTLRFAAQLYERYLKSTHWLAYVSDSSC